MKKIIRCVMILGIAVLMTCFAAGALFAQDHNVTLTWEPQNPKMNESVTFTVSAPGAEKVRLYRGISYQTFDGDHCTVTTTHLYIRALNVTASALYDGVWTPRIPVQKINYSVTGRLPGVDAVVPSSIALSSPLNVSFAKIANADRYGYCVSSDGSCRLWHDINPDNYSGQTISLTVSDTQDLPAGEYVFQIYGSAPGYIKNNSYYLFEIGGSSQSLPPAPTVSIEKDYFTLGDEEPLGITITANGVEKVRYLESSPRYFYRSSEYDNPTTLYANSFTYPGEYSLRFSVKIDGKWSAWSDPVRFTLVEKGMAPWANFSIPETVESGGILSVSIEPVANVDYYEVQIYKTKEGSSDYFTGAVAMTADKPLEIFMDNAEPGEYAIEVSCHREGYDIAEGNYQIFTVTAADFVLPANLTDINSYAFSKAGMKSVTIPTKVKIISAYAFEGCPNLTSVNISNGPTSIGEYAFANNSKLTKVTIPNSVQSIAENAFSNCSNLTTITVTTGSYADQWAQSHGFSVNYN